MNRLHACALTAGGQSIAGGAAYRFDGDWTPESVERLLCEVSDAPVCANIIETDADGPRSNSPVPLSLHQEDYHLEDRPHLLALLCVESTTAGGETIVSRVDPSTIPRSLRREQVRYYRHSAGDWTPWRPIVECVNRQPWPRITMVDVHREVELTGHRNVFDAFAERVEMRAEAIAWTPGTLVLIDNRTAVHGRRAMQNGRRKLMRWVA